MAFPGGTSAKLLVAPGQERYLDEVWPDIFAKMKKRRSLAVINVVGFGYHHFDLDEFEDFELYKPGMSRDEFLHAYLINRRNVELESLEVVAKGLKGVGFSDATR